MDKYLVSPLEYFEQYSKLARKASRFREQIKLNGSKQYLFGDVWQCINVKGIRDVDSIPNNIYDKTEKIMENYRNAHQITKYVNDTLDLEFRMLPVGINGKCKMYDYIPKLDIQEDDRIVVIVSKDKENEIYDMIINDFQVSKYTETQEIVRGQYNVIPVSMTKGLEFEKAIVVSDGMDINEKYVAYTRAISELAIVSLADGEESNSVDSELDISCYDINFYDGKLKKIVGKSLQCTLINIDTENGLKRLVISYDTETERAYVTKSVYKKYTKEINEYFGCSEY